MPARKLSAWHSSHSPDSSAQPGETHPLSSGAGALLKNLVPTMTLRPAGKLTLFLDGSSGVLNNCRRGVPSDSRERIVKSWFIHVYFIRGTKSWAGLGRMKHLSQQRCPFAIGPKHNSSMLLWKLCSWCFIPWVIHRHVQVLSFASAHLTLFARFCWSFMHLLSWHKPVCPEQQVRFLSLGR